MAIRLGAALGAVLLLLTSELALAAEVKVQPAIDGVLAAFDHYPIVALGDAHVLAQEGALWAAVVSDPRFGPKVGNVVVEFGTHQDIIDRYVAGEDVPYAQLRAVWTDAIAFVPAVIWIEYLDFFAAVRAANARLEPGQRIHVWLGHPPVDWTTLHSRGDVLPMLRTRDQYGADVIKREILAKTRKALVIYGFQHFRIANSLEWRVEADYPNSFFVIAPYFGFNEQACDRAFEARTRTWTMPVLVAPVSGTWMAGLLRRPGCTFQPELANGAQPKPEARDGLMKADENSSGVTSDALLYLGPAASLTTSPVDPAVLLDQAYFAELSRHAEISLGHKLDWLAYASGATLTAEPFDHHLGRAPAAGR
jgi:hypothetical protein